MESDQSSSTTRPMKLGEWLKLPQTIVALSALLLSVCGLFISIYEATLIRQTQRASAWPHVHVAASVQDREIELWVQNTGIGPARIEAASIRHAGETLADWPSLLDRVAGDARASFYKSQISGTVLPAGSQREVMFRLDEENMAAASTRVAALWRAFDEGTADLEVCYCSVFSECWTARFQDLLGRSRGADSATVSNAEGGCASAPRSAI